MYDTNIYAAYVSMDANPTVMLEKAGKGFKENDTLPKRFGEM